MGETIYKGHKNKTGQSKKALRSTNNRVTTFGMFLGVHCRFLYLE